MTAVPVITVFERSPDGGRGLARDMRVRWALEEVSQPYEVRPVSFAAMKEPEHRTLHPFGQIPAYEENELVLFETGAIILYIASRHEGLLPREPIARARAINWIVAALSTVEPIVVEREAGHYLERGRAWHAERQRLLEQRVLGKLTDLSWRLGNADWLDGGFSAGDLMIADVLRRLGGSGLLERFPNLAGYVARAEARPAFQRAYAAQRAFFHAATGQNTPALETAPKSSRGQDMEPTIYLFFKGNCLEAMTRYAEVLGGEIGGVFRNADAPDQDSRMPGGDDMIMNMTMTLGRVTVMASDNSEEMYEKPQGFRVSIPAASRDEFDRIFDALARDAEAVEMAPDETFWAERFAMFTDRFGTPWMLSFDGGKMQGAVT